MIRIARGRKFKDAAFHPLRTIEFVANCQSVTLALIRNISNIFFICLAASTLFIGLARSFEIDSIGGAHAKTLSLVGYNYTNRIIESYTVDYASGGDIKLSSATSGGGGISCCFDYYPSLGGKMLVKVRWQVDGCTYVLRNPVTKATADVRHLYYKEKMVEVERRTNGMPEFIETHIFPNGSVKVFLTAEISSPILRLDAERPDGSSFPRCKDGKKPPQ